MYFLILLLALNTANMKAEAGLLEDIKRRIEDTERLKREAEVRTRKEREELERALRDVAEKAREVVEKVKDEFEKEKTRLVEEAICSVRKVKSGELVSGILNLRKGTLTLKLGSLLQQPIPGENIAIKFKLSKSDYLDSVDYEILDLNRPENNQWGTIDFSKEGIEVQCDKQIRTEYLVGAQVEKWVNDLNLSKTIPDAIKLTPSSSWVDRIQSSLAK